MGDGHGRVGGGHIAIFLREADWDGLGRVSGGSEVR